MSSISVALLILVCVFGGALCGMQLGRVLPKHHLNAESRETVKLMAGLMATLSALVLGLLTASAKESYDSTNQDFRQIASRMIVLDHTLAAYGPQANEVRSFLRDGYRFRMNQLFPDAADKSGSVPIRSPYLLVETAERQLRQLVPPADAQHARLTRALQLMDEIIQSGWLTSIEQTDSSLPTPMLIVLVGWLTAMFTGFGLIAPRNATAIVALLVGALAVSTSIFLIEEMNHPLDGLIRISSAPMRSAIDYLGQ